MQEGINLLVFSNIESTQLNGCLETQDLFKTVTSLWEQDLESFKIPIKSFDMLFQTELIRCSETDSLFEAPTKMNDNRVSLLAVQSAHDDYTVGLCFLNDL